MVAMEYMGEANGIAAIYVPCCTCLKERAHIPILLVALIGAV